MCSPLFDKLKARLYIRPKYCQIDTYEEVDTCTFIKTNNKITPPESLRLLNRCPNNKQISAVYPKINSSSLTTLRSRDYTLSFYSADGVFDTEKRFLEIVYPKPPPPQNLQILPYRDTNEPASRIPACNGITTKRWDTS